MRKGAAIVAMCIEGKQISSDELAQFLADRANLSLIHIWQKVPVLRRGRKPGPGGTGAGRELVEAGDALR